MARHRHTEAEIAAKLVTASEMAAQGVLHRDIAKSLGISLMTYQRWRKAQRAPGRSVTQAGMDPGRTGASVGLEESSRISELKIENIRLRRLVADLLLEKLELQESLQEFSANGKVVERS